MKICIDLTALADNFSGIERYAACLTSRMIKEYDAYYILIFKSNVHSIFKSLIKKDNVSTVVLNSCNKLLFNQIRLPYEIHKIKADCYLFLAFPVPLFSFKKNMIVTIHDICCWDCPSTMTTLSKWYFRISHKIAVKKCRAVITISEFSKKRIIDKLKVKSDKIWLVYCGIADDFNHVDLEKKEYVKSKYGLPDKYLLSLSTLEPRKNLSLLLNAYGELVKNGLVDMPLVIAGRKGWKMDTLLETVGPKVKEKLYFTGFIDDSDISLIYNMASFFVFPSSYEGFGMPPLEAMACNTPAICSDAASLPEVCGNAALYFKNGSQKQLEDKLLQAVKMSSDERNKLIESGRRQIEKFSWKAEADKLYDYLQKIR